MDGEKSQVKVAREVEHAVRQLGGLCIGADAARRFLSGLFEMRLNPRELTAIIESEPAFAVMLFNLAAWRNEHGKYEIASIPRLVEQLPLRDIRDAFFSLKIYWPFDGDGQRVKRRRQLVANAVAVADCARRIAEESNLDIDADEAYAAGLLHSIGNLALDETMPRSFAALIKQAEVERACISDVQEKNLGLDYTVLGKRLAVKWKLPQQIQMAVWLHQGQVETLEEIIPQSQLVRAVHLGYLIARKFEIGESGSYDEIELPAEEQLPGISRLQLENISRVVKQRVANSDQHSDWQKELAEYGKAAQAAAAQLASEGSKAAAEVRRAQTKASHFDFATEFLTSINADSAPLEVAERFVCQWQKFYQTGSACLYLAPTEAEKIEAVIVAGGNSAKSLMIRTSPDEPVIPRQIQQDFAVIDAAGNCEWLLEQLGIEFDTEQAKVAPLICRGRAIGAIIFEFHYPVATSTLKEMFQETCFIAAAALDSAFARSEQQHFAERFARIAVRKKQPGKEPKTESRVDYITVLAEMAAGAAHELNNPLSVISGRAQLLAGDEADSQKAEVFRQIKNQCHQLAGVVEDLMSFAEPATPRKTLVSTRQVIDEAAELAAMKTHRDNINARIDADESVNDVFVDSGQIVSSLANIITNAVESYQGDAGPVEITAERTGELVRIEIGDSGCGMDTDTLAKAKYPFFSSKPAGRKRGMGLAYASRLIELNGGSLKLTSRVDEGTTATITLPCS